MLRGLWAIYLGLAAGIALFAVVAAVTGGSSEAGSTGPPVAVVVGVFVITAVAQVVFGRIERPLDCSTPRSLASTFQARMVMRLAVAEAGALFGVVIFFLTGEWWTLAVGLAIGGFGFLRAAPTVTALEEEQSRLTAGGCPHDLLDALRQPVAPNRG